MSSFAISWTGSLFDKEKQNRFLYYLLPVARAYEEAYFRELKDETTVEVFDNLVIKGNILISKQLLRNPKPANNAIQQSDEEEENIIDRLLGHGKPVDPMEKINRNYHICHEVALHGIQLKIKTGPHESIGDKEYFSRVAFVFFGLEAPHKKDLLIQWNIAEVEGPVGLSNLGEMYKGFDYALLPTGFMFRNMNIRFLEELMRATRHYFVPNLDWESYYPDSKIDQLIGNDPEASNPKILDTIFTAIKDSFGEEGEFERNSEQG